MVISNNCSTFAAATEKWSVARVVRDRSAKPGTAVRICYRPHRRSTFVLLFLIKHYFCPSAVSLRTHSACKFTVFFSFIFLFSNFALLLGSVSLRKIKGGKNSMSKIACAQSAHLIKDRTFYRTTMQGGEGGQ